MKKFWMLTVMLLVLAAFFAGTQTVAAQEAAPAAPLLEIQWSSDPNNTWVTLTGVPREELGELQLEGGVTVSGCWDLVSEVEGKWKCFLSVPLVDNWFGYEGGSPDTQLVSHHPSWAGGNSNSRWFRRVLPSVTYRGSWRNQVVATITRGPEFENLPMLHVSDGYEEIAWKRTSEDGLFYAILNPVGHMGFTLDGVYLCESDHEWWRTDTNCWVQAKQASARIAPNQAEDAFGIVVTVIGSDGHGRVSRQDGAFEDLSFQLLNEEQGTYYAVINMTATSPDRGLHHFFLPDFRECISYHPNWVQEVEGECWFRVTQPTVSFDGANVVLEGGALGNEGFNYAFHNNGGVLENDYRPWQTGTHNWLAGSHTMNPFPEGISGAEVFLWWVNGVQSCTSTAPFWVVQYPEGGGCLFKAAPNPEVLTEWLYLAFVQR